MAQADAINSAPVLVWPLDIVLQYSWNMCCQGFSSHKHQLLLLYLQVLKQIFESNLFSKFLKGLFCADIITNFNDKTTLFKNHLNKLNTSFFIYFCTFHPCWGTLGQLFLHLLISFRFLQYSLIYMYTVLNLYYWLFKITFQNLKK